MNAPAERVSLNEYLDDVLVTSNRLLTDLCEPADELGLNREEHLVLLMLWDADGMEAERVIERLHLPAVLVEQALRSLQQKAFVEREDGRETAGVWLTQAGREARERVGKGEMCSRLRLLERDIAALRDKLHRALDLVGEEMAGFGTGEAHA